MMYSVSISERVHWIGVNDRRTQLFENMWPLPNGVSYNSYIINDEKTALIDTVEGGSDSAYIDRIEKIIGDKPLDYLVINHMELDHSGQIEAVVRRWPDVTVVGNASTFKVLKAYYGEIFPNLVQLKDQDEISLGHHNLRFIFTPWVHWPETMMTYETTDKILFSGDAFGTFGTVDGLVLDRNIKFEYYESEMRRYYSNIVGKYSNMVQKAFAKLEGVEIETICSLHGPIWQQNAQRVMGLYDRWSKHDADDAVVVIYASMYGNGAITADYIAHSLAEKGINDIRVYDVSKTHLSYLISEIWRCRYVVLGSCAYNSEMFPLMQLLCNEVLLYKPKNKYLSLFGTYSWNGGGVKALKAFAETCEWEMVGEPAEIHGRPDGEKYAACDALADAIAAKFNSK